MRLLFVMVFLSNVSFAQEITYPTNETISYKVSLSNLHIGKPFQVQFQMPPDIQAIIEIDSNVTVQGDTDLTVVDVQSGQLSVDVTPFSPVPYPMPSILLTVLTTNGTTNQFYTPSFMIPISNDIVSNTNLVLLDIEKPYFVFDYLWLIIALAVLLVVGVLFLLPRLNNAKAPIAPVEEIDPFEQMETRLKQLRTKRLELNDENYKEFFVAISESVREFLSRTILSSALETPTRDLLKDLSDRKTNEDILEIITFILRSTDRAKYAKQIFTDERIDEVLGESRRLFDIMYRRHQKSKKEQNEKQEKENELRKS